MQPTTAKTYPLVRRLGLQGVAQRDAQSTQPRPQLVIEQSQQGDSLLSAHVRQAWTENKLAKVNIDRRLLACLRARRGVYSAQELMTKQQAGGVNILWYDLTETKCRAASAWIREILLPTSGETPWDVQPSPIPDLPLPFKKSIVSKSIEQAQQVLMQIHDAGGAQLDREQFRETVREIGEKLRSEAEEKYKKAAEQRARRMKRVIMDRQAQGFWDKATDAFVEDFVTYPAAILHGPVYQRHQELAWGEGWKPEVRDVGRQCWRAVSPFDAYPAPGAETPQDGNFIERMRFFRKDMHALKGLPGYRDDEIDAALKDYSNGHLEGWLWTESERQRLTQESLYMWLSPPGVIDALNFYGSVPGWKLVMWGIEGVDYADLQREYEVNVLLCGKYVLYASINPHPLGQRPYRRACYDAIPGAFWGRAIPDLIETMQRFCNVLSCAMADNIAMSSGPMVWVHIDRLADGDQSLEIIPWKSWQLKDAGMGSGTNPGIGFFQANDNSEKLQKLLDVWELKADDACGIPRYTYGNEQLQGAAATATGLGMLLNSAAKGLRRAISNCDLNVIAPTVNDTFVNEMLYNPDTSIKGDNVIVPRGASAILIKDVAQQRRMQALGMTANPIDMQIIGLEGRAQLLRETFESMELGDGIVPSEEQLAKRQAEQAEQQQAMAMAEQQQEVDRMAMQGQLDQQNRFSDFVTSLVKEQMKLQTTEDQSIAAEERAASIKPPARRPAASKGGGGAARTGLAAAA